MIVRAAGCLPPAEKWIFICRDELIARTSISEILERRFPHTTVLTCKSLTDGQVCTCLLAEKLLRPSDILTIGACDNAMLYNHASQEDLIADPAVDAIVWTFRHNPAVLQDPQMYGWVEVDSQNRAIRVSCKRPISSTPQEDHAIIGAFSFSRAADFLLYANQLVSTNRRTNGEFYLDDTINIAIEAGLRIRVMEVDQYICWGTPRDVETYNYWQAVFLGLHPNGKTKAGRAPLPCAGADMRREGLTE